MDEQKTEFWFHLFLSGIGLGTAFFYVLQKPLLSSKSVDTAAFVLPEVVVHAPCSTAPRYRLAERHPTRHSSS